jgi:signal transduction histidine kinase
MHAVIVGLPETMSFWSRWSLAVKIPLLTSLLLLLALAAMSVASYVELRGALVAVATSRLQQAADQMATVFGNSSRQRLASMKQFMLRPEIRDYLRHRDDSTRDAVGAAVKSHLGATGLLIADIELWDVTGRRVFAAGAAFDEVTGDLLEMYRQELYRVDEAVIGRFRRHGQEVAYPVGGRVSHDGQPIGYVVERRRMTNPTQSRQTVDLLTGLIGNQASMLIGNADGSAWSDLATAIPDVPIRGGDRAQLWDYQRAGMPRTFAWATPIAATPWAVAIEFPRDVVLAPSQRFVFRSMAIAITVLLFAAAAGWASTRGITTSLRDVTEAAEAVAESQQQVHVDSDRHDEIGRLADSFNTMAAKVEQGRIDLELRVELRTAELRAANRELEAFSYSVSHDLRAPLRAIAGFVQILEEDHAEKFDTEARRALDRVKINARRMGQLIDDLLAFSQIGRSTMLRQSVDLTAIAKAVAEEAIATSEKKIDLTVETLPPVYGEASLLNQVFVNLVSNAVKFTARVSAPAITIGSTTTNGETVYYVRDNGVGFDDRYAAKLFGVFQRLHRPDEFEGTGVGLAIVHRIISRHGGRVWAEGRMNAGATFYFTLPASPASAKASEAKASADAGKQSLVARQ